MGHALLKGQVYYMCLVDEAGQITLPAALAPLLQARSFCLVGDPYQLPPLVQNPQAKTHGLSDSLFHRLSQAHPQVGAGLRDLLLLLLPLLLHYTGYGRYAACA